MCEEGGGIRRLRRAPHARAPSFPQKAHRPPGSRDPARAGSEPLARLRLEEETGGGRKEASAHRLSRDPRTVVSGPSSLAGRRGLNAITASQSLPHTAVPSSARPPGVCGSPRCRLGLPGALWPRRRGAAARMTAGAAPERTGQPPPARPPCVLPLWCVDPAPLTAGPARR